MEKMGISKTFINFIRIFHTGNSSIIIKKGLLYPSVLLSRGSLFPSIVCDTRTKKHYIYQQKRANNWHSYPKQNKKNSQYEDDSNFFLKKSSISNKHLKILWRFKQGNSNYNKGNKLLYFQWILTIQSILKTTLQKLLSRNNTKQSRSWAIHLMKT